MKKSIIVLAFALSSVTAFAQQKSEVKPAPVPAMQTDSLIKHAAEVKALFQLTYKLLEDTPQMTAQQAKEVQKQLGELFQKAFPQAQPAKKD
jgi:hypothetical protein